MHVTRMFGFAAAAVATAATCSFGQVRVAQWNITNWGTGSVATRGTAFQTSFYGVVPSGPLAGQKYAPDIIIAEEIQQGGAPTSIPVPAGFQTTGQASVNAFLDLLNNTAHNPAIVSPGDWAAAPYVANQGDTGNALFYRTSKVQWVSTITLGTLNVDVAQISSGPPWYAPRDNQRWRIRLVGYTGAGAELYVYGAHFKAGSAGSDNSRRLPEATRIRNNAETIPADAGGFLLGADTNVQTSSQTAYQALVASASIGQFVDPINSPGSWNGNANFKYIHTQEPATQMDDRHDQILVSGSLLSHQGLAYLFTGTTITGSNPYGIPTFSTMTWNDTRHSYRCWGNDGAHFSGAINAAPTNAQVGQSIADALVTTVSGNGHLSVYMDLQVPAKLGAPAGTIDLGTVAQNSTTTYTLPVSNAADFTRYSKDGSGYGIDNLTYSLGISSSSFSLPGGTGPFEAPPTNPVIANNHVVSLNTSTTGSKSATVTITTDDPDNPTRTLTIIANVQSTAQPGACCSPSTGACSFILQSACNSPSTWSAAASCTSPNPCPQPGACCSSAGECVLLLQVSCTAPNSWSGASTCTSPNPCPQPGACCSPLSGECSLTLQSACTSPNTWNGAASCSAPNPCPEPTGACCVGTTCSSATLTACTGTFQGSGTMCSPPSNPVVCCFANFDQVNGLAVADIFAYLNAWFGGSSFADTNHSGQLEIQDIFDFLNLWFAGC